MPMRFFANDLELLDSRTKHVHGRGPGRGDPLHGQPRVYRTPVESEAESTLAFQGARRSERWSLVAIRPAKCEEWFYVARQNLTLRHPLRYGQPCPLPQECRSPLTKGSEHWGEAQ